jgi:hypothetical protein
MLKNIAKSLFKLLISRNVKIITKSFRKQLNQLLIGWGNFIALSKDLLINQFLYDIYNMSNFKQH